MCRELSDFVTRFIKDIDVIAASVIIKSAAADTIL